MARVTAEDCLDRVSNPFTLTRIAAKRARQLCRGAVSKLPWEDHKATVLALQEVAAGQVTPDILNEADLPLVEPPKVQLEVLE